MATKRGSKKAGSATKKTGATRQATKQAPVTSARSYARETRTGARSVKGAGRALAPAGAATGAALGATATILAWEDDPMSFPARNPIEMTAPALPTGTLGITIVEAAPPAQIHPVGTSRFRYWTAAETLTRGMEFWGKVLPAGTRWATPTGTLQVHLDFGDALNAFYRRGANRLEFYHATVGSKTIFSGESPNVVAHELGHAVLDAVRPQLFNAMSTEVAAFHESFGDISSILIELQLESVRRSVLSETGGRLFQSTFLSRMGEELGFGIRQRNPQRADPDCLRNAVNAFFYRDPATLPTDAPASALSSSPHSFSRVFTSAFYDAFAGMVLIDNPAPTQQSLQKVSRDAGRLIIEAVRNAPVVPNYFSQVAAQLLAVDQARFNRKYRDVIKGAFVRHGILSLAAAAAIVGPPVPVSAFAGITESAATSVTSASGDNMAELPSMAIPATAFGLNASTIICAAPSESGGYLMAAAAALDTGSVTPPRESDATKSFVEDLFRLGRIEVGAYGDPDMEITQPLARKTHVLKGAKSTPMLVRETFDCGFD
jgi:hypothetical protein